MTTPAPARGLIALLRLPYWLMTGGLSLLTAFAITKNPLSLSVQTAVLIFFSMAFITSAGFAINDYFDRESDAVIKPKRPIPSGALSLKAGGGNFRRAFRCRLGYGFFTLTG